MSISLNETFEVEIQQFSALSAGQILTNRSKKGFSTSKRQGGKEARRQGGKEAGILLHDLQGNSNQPRHPYSSAGPCPPHNRCVEHLPFFDRQIQMNVAETAFTFGAMVVIDRAIRYGADEC